MTEKKREELIKFFTEIQTEAGHVIQQLQDGKECLFTHSSHLTSAAGAESLEFSVGVEPESGEKMFKLYLPPWAK